MKYARYIALAMTAICMGCAFIQSTTRLRVQRDKHTAFQLGVASQKFQFIEETGPDVSAAERPWSGRTVSSDDDCMMPAFSAPSNVRWSGFEEDWDAPAGQRTPCWDVRSIGAGTVAMSFAGIWLLLQLASHRARRAQPRGFDVVVPVNVA